MDASSSRNGPSSSGQENHDIIPRQLDRCGFCNAKDSLTPCDGCGFVAYCTEEHQMFDWKRHKPICKTILAKRDQRLNQSGEKQPFHNSGNMECESEANGFANTSAFRPYSQATAETSASTESVAMNESPTPASPEVERSTSECPSAGTPSIDAQDSPLTEERIIETDDPDIQIIEGPSTAGQGTPVRPRKRANPVYLKNLKDHSQNRAYNVTPEEHRRFLMDQGRAFNQHQSAELRLTYISEHILRALTEYGWAVIDNFLGMDHCWHVHKEIRVLESRGLFGAGQLVEAKNKDEQHVKDIRSDKTYWFGGADDKSSDACTIRMLVTYLDGIVNKFSRRLPGYQIHGRSKAMLAIYPGNGSRYVKHVDNPAKDGRRITVIYYCNPDWDHIKDGGVLRLYPETSATPLDIEPRADRLIAFWSDNRIPHEVMPVFKDRLAITVWYMDRHERDKHIKKADPRPMAPTATAHITSSKPISPSLEDGAKAAKEQRMEVTPQPAVAATTVADDLASEGELSVLDSGRGTSIPSQSTRFSLTRENNSRGSVDLSDDDDTDLPIAKEQEPEYNI